jgi:hypothetical protein
VFISYANEDAEVALSIAARLTARGIDTWIDKGKLRSGDHWRLEIEVQIKKCSYFVPVVTPSTEYRHEGNFRREWKAAIERMNGFADGVPFILPALIGIDVPQLKLVPAEFLNVHCSTLKGEKEFAAFVERVKRLYTDRPESSTDATKPIQPGNLERRSGVPEIEISPRLRKQIAAFRFPTTIKNDIYEVLANSGYPEFMSIAGRLTMNPTWEHRSADEKRRLLSTFRLTDSTAPGLMSLDLFLIRANDDQGHGKLYTYYSKRWDCYLFPFRKRDPGETLGQRASLNVKTLTPFVSAPPTRVSISPIRSKVAISVKHDEDKHDLKLYVFQLCSVVFDLPSEQLASAFREVSHRGDRTPPRWWYMQELLLDPRVMSVNGDVLSLVHEFGVGLGLLPSSVANGFLDHYSHSQ